MGAIPSDRSPARPDDHVRLCGDFRGVPRLDRGARPRPQPGKSGTHLPLLVQRALQYRRRSPGRARKSQPRSTDRTPRSRSSFRPASPKTCARAKRRRSQIIVDGTNSNTALIALGYVNQIVADLSRRTSRSDLAQRCTAAQSRSRRRSRSSPAPLVQPRLQQPLVLRARRDRHADAGDGRQPDGLRRRARARGRHARADHGDADPAVRIHPRQDDAVLLRRPRR